MSDPHYSNDKIDSSFQEIKQILMFQNKTLDEIKAQTTKTNGRVTKLEGWRSWGAGAIAIVVVLVIPLIVFIFQDSIQQLRNEITQLKLNGK